uniref:Complex I assembly factor TIMMDC1, mitochondrial n=1 Tax=Coturnix japonica TaxID=93934 RepID=A0A8C2SVQ9_COTJA
MAEGLGAGGTFGRPTPPPQTGWERLSELWRRDELQRYPEETINIIKSAFTGGLVGWLYGGLPAFRQARRAFIEGSQGDVFHNRADAVQSAHRAGLRGFIRYGWRWMFTLWQHFSLGEGYSAPAVLELLSLESSGGIPAGGLVMIAQKLTGETLQEKRNRERREQYEQKLAEWQARLSVTEDLGRMESDGLGQSQTENIF